MGAFAPRGGGYLLQSETHFGYEIGYELSVSLVITLETLETRANTPKHSHTHESRKAPQDL